MCPFQRSRFSAAKDGLNNTLDRQASMNSPLDTQRQHQESGIARIDRNRWGWLVLFGSSATLVCCALPIVLVTLGLGSVSAALFANLPFLTLLAHHKLWLFAGSFLALAGGGWALFRRARACPADPQLALQCERSHYWNTRLWWLSVVLWALGFIAAYAALPLWLWLGE